MYQEQLHRIQQKLSQAKAADKDLEVFGAETHEYHLNPPVSEAEVLAFEKNMAYPYLRITVPLYRP